MSGSQGGMEKQERCTRRDAQIEYLARHDVDHTTGAAAAAVIVIGARVTVTNGDVVCIGVKLRFFHSIHGDEPADNTGSAF